MRRRRGRNSPYGSTIAERGYARRARRKPSRVHGPKGRSGVLLGALDELIVCTPRGDRTISSGKTRGLFVVWVPGTNDLRIVRKVGGARRNVPSISAQDERVFRQFHKSAPKVGTYDWPDKRGSLRKLGRLRSLTYIVPKWVTSMEKWNYKWVHAFGDHGESGHGPHTESKKYPERLMPVLAKDDGGHLHIVRMPGNRYKVSEWIYW